MTLTGSRLWKIFATAFGLALAVESWAVYLRLTQHPAPKWTEGLPIALIEIVFGFYFLLVPVPGLAPSSRRTFIVLFFALGALILVT